MAMTKCKECGSDISTKAASCPKCGAKQVKTSGCTKIVLFFIIAIAIVPIISVLYRDDSVVPETITTPPNTTRLTRGDVADRNAAREVERCAKQYLGRPKSGPDTEVWIMCLHTSSELAKRNKINVARQVIHYQGRNVFVPGQSSADLSQEFIDRINRGE